MTRIGAVSGDSHVNEPRDLWRENLPSRYRELAMRGIEAGEDGNWNLVLEGTHIDKTEKYEVDRMKVTDPVHRYEVMREDGIVGECIYPTIGLYVWMLDDAEGGAASCRVYNEWIADGLARSPRFKCAGIVPTWDVDRAIEEVCWIADAGLGSVMIPMIAPTEWNHRSWEPLWSAIEETGLPVAVHQGTGHTLHFYRGPGAGVSNLLATQSMAPRMVGLLASSGVLAMHPELHFVFVECNIGWLAWTMETLDHYMNAFLEAGTTVTGKKWVNVELEEPPSYYVRRQIHATFQDDQAGLNNISVTGPRALLWGSDYPHHEGTYPHSMETVARLSAGLDEHTTDLVFRQNAIDLFHFDADVLAEPV